MLPAARIPARLQVTASNVTGTNVVELTLGEFPSAGPHYPGSYPRVISNHSWMPEPHNPGAACVPP